MKTYAVEVCVETEDVTEERSVFFGPWPTVPIKDIQEVLDYLWQREEEDYDEREHYGDPVEGHIFNNLLALQRWLDETGDASYFAAEAFAEQARPRGGVQYATVHELISTEEPLPLTN